MFKKVIKMDCLLWIFYLAAQVKKEERRARLCSKQNAFWSVERDEKARKAMTIDLEFSKERSKGQLDSGHSPNTMLFPISSTCVGMLESDFRETGSNSLRFDACDMRSSRERKVAKNSVTKRTEVEGDELLPLSCRRPESFSLKLIMWL